MFKKRTDKAKKASGKKPPKLPKKSKNKSQKIPDGRTLQTRDGNISGGLDKPGYQSKGDYRRAVVVDSNRNDELAVIRLTTSAKGNPLTDYKDGKSKYRPYVYTLDKNGKPIKVGRMFVENPASRDVSKKDVNTMKLDSLTAPGPAEENQKRLRKLKGRNKPKK